MGACAHACVCACMCPFISSKSETKQSYLFLIRAVSEAAVFLVGFSKKHADDLNYACGMYVFFQGDKNSTNQNYLYLIN